MKEAITDPIIIKRGCSADALHYLSDKFRDNYAVVCSDKTRFLAEKAFPCKPKIVFPGGSHATEVNADILMKELVKNNYSALVACDSGSVHDITRYVCHAVKKTFVSFPTAPSVDGFVSGIAAMTIRGRKISYPSTPPVALFADADIYGTAPPELTASGIGDIVGKYVSLFDWRFTSLITDETVEEDIYSLEQDALEKVMNSNSSETNFIELVMDCLVKSGVAIQLKGSSRPASGAEHHLSHLWEMNCINKETNALHGEKVGVSALLVLKKYKSCRKPVFIPKSLDPNFLRPVYGSLTEGIIEENTPDPLSEISQEKLNAASDKIRQLIDELPQPEKIKNFLLSVRAKTTLGELGLPDTSDFAEMSLKYAPYVRRRLTMLKII